MRRLRRVRGSLRWFLVAIVAGLILIASVVRPGPGIASSGPLNLVSVSVWAHLWAYGLLTLTLLYAFRGDGRSMVPPVVVPVIVICYGALVELVQLPIAYRTFSVADILVNAVGSIVVVLCWVVGGVVFERA